VLDRKIPNSLSRHGGLSRSEPHALSSVTTSAAKLLRAIRRGGSPRISPGCRSYSASLDSIAPISDTNLLHGYEVTETVVALPRKLLGQPERQVQSNQPSREILPQPPLTSYLFQTGVVLVPFCLELGRHILKMLKRDPCRPTLGAIVLLGF
jgi:hypothetical protein